MKDLRSKATYQKDMCSWLRGSVGMPETPKESTALQRRYSDSRAKGLDN